MRRRLTAVAGVLVLVVLLTSCLGVAGDERLALFGDFPDPSAVPVGPHMLMMYSTTSRGMHVPSFCFDTKTDRPGCLSDDNQAVDALPHPETASWFDAGRALTWAPSVRKIGNHWVMVVVAGVNGRGAPCIGWATAAAARGPFTITGTPLCASNIKVGLFDPYLFLAPNGWVWLYYSRQWSARGGSEIDAQRLSKDGMRLVGPATIMVSYNDVAALNTGGNGVLPFIENPAVVVDPTNRRDLLVSIGDWRDHGYNTIQIPCEASNGACSPSGARLLRLSSKRAPKGEAGTGGASLVQDGSPNGNHIVFHGWPCGAQPCVDHYGAYQARVPYIETTGACIDSHTTICRSLQSAPAARAQFAELPRRLASPGVLAPGATYQWDHRTTLP